MKFYEEVGGMTIDPLNNLHDQVPVEVLRRQAEQHPDVVFLRDAESTLTYAETDAMVDRVSTGLTDLGLGVGGRVVMFMENSVDLVLTALAVNRAGGIWSPLSTEYRGEWLRELFVAVGAEILVVDAHHLPEVIKLDSLPFKHVVIRGGTGDAVVGGAQIHDLETLKSVDARHKDVELRPGDTSAVLWTSGTTGRSKGVMQSHAVWMLWAQRHNEVFRGGVGPGEVFYYCMPLYNSGGWVASVFPALVSGGTAALDKRFSVADFWNRIRHYGANHTMTLGTMHVYLFQQDPKPDDADNPLRSLIMNPVIPQLMRPFMDRFGVERVASGFGQSEIMGATLYTSELSLKPGSCGYTVEDDLVETKLLDDNDREVGVNEVGEICVRPRVPNAIFSGYLDEPERTLETFRNLWHHSGDLGRRDEDGEIFFVDRKKDSLRHKGRNTATFEVEHIARQFPGVAGVAAVGVPDPHLESEEELMIVLQVAPDATVDPLEFCKFVDEKAPYFFVPRYVQIIEQFPMTPTGKIQKFVLRQDGVTSRTWDRTVEAPDWTPTRPASRRS